MAENKLPSGVGKKIVEALKKQAEIEIQPITDTIKENVVAEPQEIDTLNDVITDNISFNEEFADFSIEEEPVENNDELANNNFDLETNDIVKDSFDEEFPRNVADGLIFDEPRNTTFDEKEIFAHAQQPILNSLNQQSSYSMPANVAVLKRLIMQLPQGVTKQTGAQIIRQTMEALGISMNSVLKEAQQGQDSLTTNAKACLSQIAEYKNNIRSLEKQVQDYKKQAIALNDLISLFVMTDKH